MNWRLTAMTRLILVCLVFLSSGASFVAQNGRAAEPGSGRFAPIRNEVVLDFPKTVNFALEGVADFDVRQVELLYSLAGDDTLNLATPDFTPGEEINVDHDLNTRVNFVPAGIDVTYHWRLTGDDGEIVETEPQTMLWQDERFNWTSISTNHVAVYTYHGNEAFSQSILDSAQRTIDRLLADFDVDQIDPVRIWAYNSRDDFQGTQLSNSESWIVGTAYPEYNVILAVLPLGDDAEIGRVVPHEISHQVLHQATANPFNHPPTWLDEGLAVMNQEGGDQDFPALVQDAAEDGRLFSVRALNAQFPYDPAGAALAYAESLSIVRFIVDYFGIEKLASLIAAYREGQTHDEAALEALGVDLDGLDQLWKQSLGYRGDQAQAGGQTNGSSDLGSGAHLLASGALFMGAAAVAAIAVGFVVMRRSRREQSELGEEAW